MNKQNFVDTTLHLVNPGHHVLDLGAGNGTFAQIFVERGARVTVVDISIRKITDPSVTTKKMRVEDFVEIEQTGKFGLIFARNILQFLDKPWVFETLFPWLDDHLSSAGVIAVETFYQDPEPPFDHPMRSLYTLQELTTHFISWEELLARQYEHRSLDMSGHERTFFTTDMIVRKRQ